MSETGRRVTLAALKAERASVAAKGRQIETEAAPIRYVAELLGIDTDSERAIRWLIALIADNTMRKSDTFADFAASYHDRLRALGRVQGLLLRQQREDRVTFDELIEDELVALSVHGGDRGRVTLDGPKGIGLLSGTVQTLAMAVHELTTNAVRYGAPKQPNGHLTIRWRQEISEERGEPRLHVDWKESGVEVPTSVGGTAKEER